VIEGIIRDLIWEVVEVQFLVGGMDATVGVFTEKGVDSCMYCSRFPFLLWASDLSLGNGIVDRADLKQAISPMEL
jgi:hypothetical protein